MEIKKNRLWGGLPTAENLALAEAQKWFYANLDHVLVVAQENPGGLIELDEGYWELLQGDDLLWLSDVSEEIRKEQEKQYGEQFLAMQEEFLRRFEEELRAIKEEAGLGGDSQKPKS